VAEAAALSFRCTIGVCNDVIVLLNTEATQL
jgi:hypothetical protein